MQANAPAAPAIQRLSTQGAVAQRLMSLDALRGFDMFWIMGGDLILRSLPKIHDSAFTRALASQMEHCPWAGFHFYDLIFPLFVFLAGVAIVYSVPKLIEREGCAAAIKRIVIRSAVLFLLGIFYMGGVRDGFKNIYFAGVLQRIAVAYFFTALIFCFAKTRWMVAICIGLLAGYWALMTFIPVPGMGTPSLAEPGKNLAHYLDELYLPGQKFEGTLLSTMAAVANCLLGVFAGRLLQNPSLAGQSKVYWLFGSGILGLLLGFAWSLQFPIIKLLWTSSYVLVACGFSAILLAVFYQMIEIWQWRKWVQPFVWMGLNAITIYVAANVIGFQRLALRFVGGDIRRLLGPWGDLAQALLTTAFAFCLVYFLYRRRIFLRL
jgi:predicted acyltransferase